MTDITRESISLDHGDAMYKLGLDHGGFTKISDAINMLENGNFKTSEDAILALYSFRNSKSLGDKYAKEATADHNTSEQFPNV